MGKAHALLEQISESADSTQPAQEALMATYAELTGAGVTTRDAAALTGLARSTATRRRPAARRAGAGAAGGAPANRLTAAERLRILAVLNSDRFVDLPPIADLRHAARRGRLLCSISTMYRMLAEHAQVIERRRLARHPARAVPELVATGRGRCTPGTSPNSPARSRATTTTPT